MNVDMKDLEDMSKRRREAEELFGFRRTIDTNIDRTSDTNIDLIYTDLKDSNKSLDSSLEKIDLFQNIEQSEMIEILRSIVIDLYLISNDQQKLIDHLISQRK